MRLLIKWLLTYESDIDELTQELSEYQHAAELAYQRLASLADAIDEIAVELAADGVIWCEDVRELACEADIAAGEISMLIHPTTELEL